VLPKLEDYDNIVIKSGKKRGLSWSLYTDKKIETIGVTTGDSDLPAKLW